MDVKDERAQFKVPAVVRVAVREIAQGEDLPESVIWRRVVLAGLSALGVGLPGPAVRVEPAAPSPTPVVAAVPRYTQAEPEPAGWDPLNDIA